MKSLGIFVSTIAIILSIVVSFSSPEKALAQTISGQSINPKGDYSYFQNQSSALFKNALTQLENYKQTRIKTGKDVKTIVDNINAYSTLVQEAQSEYNQSFEKEKTSLNQTPSRSQANAMRAALNKYNSLYATKSSTNDFTSDPDVNSIRLLVEGNGTMGGMTGLIKQADSISNNLITAGSQQANALTNADAITTVGEKRAGAIASKCSIGVLGDMDLPACLNEGVTWLIKNTILQIAGFLVWLTANMFNYAMQVGILEFSRWAPDALYPIWVIVRQILSLLIVFIGLYLGLLYILGEKEGKFAQYIPWVVIFGLFVNFSYPLTRTAIDISNIVSLNIYTSAVGSEALNATNVFSFQSGGGLIMQRLGLQGLVASAIGPADTTNMIGTINSIPGALMAVAFVLYSAYVFFRLTLIIIVRTATLVFITIASPLLLVDSVFPLLGDKAKQLREIFFAQLAVGPVFTILLALTLKFLEVFSSIADNGPLSGGTGVSGLANGASVVVFFNIAMMLAMLYFMVTITEKTSGEFGKFATGKLGAVGGFGLGVASGGTGFLARRAIGGAALKMHNKDWVQKQGNFFSRRAYELSSSLANSTFDVRNGYVGNKMKKLGLDMGMGSKLGYEKSSEERTARIIERGKRIKTKYERDTVGADGKWHRKGEVNEEMAKAKNEYFANKGGAMFLTKLQKDKIDDEIVEEASAKNLEEYKRKGKGEKLAFMEEKRAELEEMEKRDPKLETVEAKILKRTVNDIGVAKKESDDALAKEIESAKNRLKNILNESKKNEAFATFTKEVQEALIADGTYTVAAQTRASNEIQASVTKKLETPPDISGLALVEEAQVATPSAPLDVSTESFSEKRVRLQKEAIAKINNQVTPSSQEGTSAPDSTPATTPVTA